MAQQDILEFYSAFRLPWYEVLDGIASKIRHSIFGGAGKENRGSRRKLSKLRSCLYEKDKERAGLLQAKMFKEVLSSADLSLSPEDLGELIEVLEVSRERAGGKLVRYREILKWLLKQMPGYKVSNLED